MGITRKKEKWGGEGILMNECLLWRFQKMKCSLRKEREKKELCKKMVVNNPSRQ